MVIREVARLFSGKSTKKRVEKAIFSNTLEIVWLYFYLGKII